MSPDTVEWRPLGDLAMWFFILAKLSVLSLLLLTFAGAQAWQLELFYTGREQLGNRWGLLLAVVLPSSGWPIVLTVHAVRRGWPCQMSSQLLAVPLPALVYVGPRLHEYGRLVDLGLDIGHDTLFTFHRCLTSFYFLYALLDPLILG